VNLKSDRELENTKRKLRLLEEGYEEARADTEDEHLRELEMESLKRLINQLKEEIARYEAHQPGRRATVQS
jgi:flagellar biosynthesis chaperone FliJ